jgi:serine/threonine-protein kinase
VQGTPFGRYRLISLLGRGGMGEVWRAYDTGTDRTIAVKVLLPHFASNPTFEQRFRREAQAAARLDSPHVVPIHDYGEIDGRLFVAMRLIAGRDLHTVLTERPLEPQRAVRVIEQIAAALDAAHKIGLVHRDVKPSNILLDNDDYAYLIDFGIARAASDTGLTGTGNTVGTWAYMAPERLTSGHGDSRSDVYALACVLHESLTGTKPYPGNSFEQQIVGHLTTPPPRPSAAHPYIPAALDDVIAIGMAKDPDQRYRTTRDLAVAARTAITQPIPVAPPSTAGVPVQPTQPVTRVIPPPSDRIPPPPPIPPAYATQIAPQPPPAWGQNPAQYPQQHPLPPRPPEWQPHGFMGGGAPAAPTAAKSRVPLLVGAAAVVVVAAIVATLAIVKPWEYGNAPPRDDPTPSKDGPVAYGTQVTLPYSGLNQPSGIAVDGSGNTYVTDFGNDRVVKLAAGATTQTEVPFGKISDPTRLAVDSAGTLYVTLINDRRVVKLTAGGSAPSDLPFGTLSNPIGVAVDRSDTVYITDIATGTNDRVLSLGANATAPNVIPMGALIHPIGVAVDDSGNTYVTDFDGNEVVKLAEGATAPTTLPFTGLNQPNGIATDTAGAVYVTDYANNRVLKLDAGATAPTTLPFTGLNHPEGVAVDSAGNVYITDADTNRVLKLPVE